MNHIDDLVYWVKEREAMRVRRESGEPPPWTTSQIMANNRWCNVRREDDKVTRWIFQNFMPHRDNQGSIPFAMCLARLVNWPDTLALLGYPNEGWTPLYRERFLDVFFNLRSEGTKAWTGAYMVTGGYSKGGEPKEQIIARVLDGAAKQCTRFVNDRPQTLAEAANILSTPGMGQFLVAQVIADLKNTSILKDASDWWTWCAPGPGSTMGLNFIHGRRRTQNIAPSDFIKEVNVIRTIIENETGLQLCAQNTQNCLCELSKYIRAKYYGERLKNRYVPS